jgi:predicted porin
MQKKIIALAIASALTAPALAMADTANVNFYGVLNADVELVRVGTAGSSAPTLVIPPTTSAVNPTSRGRVTSNASRFGLSGSEDLGNGLTGIFQIESRVNLTGTETAAGGGIFDVIRNSNLGLKGAFGTAFVGQWDTPFKVSHNKVELFDNTTIATATAILGSLPGAQNAFNVRQGSSIQYWTPDMAGFKVMGAYSMNSTNATDTATVHGAPQLLSVSGAYDAGPIYVALAYESHKSSAVALAPSGTDKGTRAVAAFTTDAFQVGATVEKLTLAENGPLALQHAAAPGGDVSRTAYSLEGKFNIPAAGTIAATYTHAGDISGSTDTGATQISLRYGYMMSKRTELYAMYTSINNKKFAYYNFSDVAAIPGAVGSKVSGYGAGVRHTF